MTNEEKEINDFVANHMNAIEQNMKEQTQHIEKLMWATDKPSMEFEGLASYMQEVKPMTNEEKLINIAGLVYTLRDLLEDVDFDRELKQRTKNYATYLDKVVKRIAADREVWEELDKLQEYFYDNFVRSVAD
jgi:hypothetical protein